MAEDDLHKDDPDAGNALAFAPLSSGTIDASSPDRFINRELSWLSFNTRVLEEADNERHPLLERLRFLSISANNLDEFQMARVAGLRAQVDARVTTPSIDGLTPLQQLDEIKRQSDVLVARQYATWRNLRGLLRQADIVILEEEELTRDDRSWLTDRFDEEILPILTPASRKCSKPMARSWWIAGSPNSPIVSR